jgi:hypothetical protein
VQVVQVLRKIKNFNPMLWRGERFAAMKFLKHLLENPFITFTGLAALVHSTWSLGTLFSGVQPLGDMWLWTAWVLPAFFIAFALDVGQISTSAKIRHYGLNWQRGLAFFVFSVATYYLQFLYIAHHMPSLAIAAGVSDFHQWAVVTARDAAIWILPLLLPLSTMLYTISDGDVKAEPKADEPEILIETPKKDEKPLIEEKVREIESSVMLTEEIIQEPKYQAECDDCGWSVEYPNKKKADRALRTHQTLHCTKGLWGEKMLDNGHVG